MSDEILWPRLSTAPLAATDGANEVDAEYRCVIVGSGFGGAVMAARLAAHFEPGTIAVLERGREFQPGEFPSSTGAALREIKSPVNPLGLFDFFMRPDLDLLCASALGGGSTIYANVTLEPDPSALDAGYWPPQLTHSTLRPYFDRVRGMLAVEKYIDRDDLARGDVRDDPTLSGSFFFGAEDGRRRDSDTPLTDYRGRDFAERPPLAKAERLREFAAQSSASMVYQKAPIAVNLSGVTDGEQNAHGITRRKCNLCGDCVTGCNRGAKNTLCTNYLPLARKRGVLLRTQTEVIAIEASERPGCRYRLRCREWFQRSGRWRSRERTVHAAMVVLSAGVVGTTGLLLRAQRLGALLCSDRLGHGISGNADLISFSYAGHARTDSVGGGAAAAWEVGPTIVSSVTVGEVRGTRRFIVQEGTWPALLAGPVGRLMGGGHLLRRGRAVWRDLLKGNPQQRPDSALNHSMVWLAMGPDQARGRLTLSQDDRIDVDWPSAGGQPIFDSIHSVFSAFSAALGARYVRNPREAFSWIGRSGSTPITVHPLGGCRMARDASCGVTDHVGRVFRGDGGGVHEGLYVSDGSLCSGALGVNPSLTIAALAERAAEHIIRDDLAMLMKNAG